MTKYFYFLFISLSSMAGTSHNLDLQHVTQGKFPLAYISPYDGSSDMFIVEKGGLIQKYSDGQISHFLDISDKLDLSHVDQGLLGLVFDPDYKDNGFFYVYYIRPGGAFNSGVSVIERYHHEYKNEQDIDTKLNFEKNLLILEIDQPYLNHNGGTMHFGPDGYLYIALGDGGGQQDPNNNSQNLNNLLGKMIRINVNPDIIYTHNFNSNHKCGQISNYYIPKNNPFIIDSGACDEIFFYGLRSPWKWSFDQLTNDFFIGDVGQASFEEISFIPHSTYGGENLGWSCKEGNEILIAKRCPEDNLTLTDPIISYPHNQNNSGNSIVGGYRYRGNEIPSLYGFYIYADTISGNIWFAEFKNNKWNSELWDQTVNYIVSFAEDEYGNIYTVSLNGSINKFVLSKKSS